MKHSENFVGRQKELRSALKILKSEKSLIVEGPFGIGKTTFAKKVAYEFGSVGIHCTFEDNALSMIESLNRQLIKYYRPGGARLGTQIQKFLKATDGKKVLITIDDIWKVTLQKVRFFKRLNANLNCQFILISEVRGKDSLLLVKSIAWNNETIKLGKLSRAESEALFHGELKRLKGPFTSELSGLIDSCRGYPLGLVETAKLSSVRAGT